MRKPYGATARAAPSLPVAAVAVALLPGCASLMIRLDPDWSPRVYGGTVLDLGMITHPVHGLPEQELPFPGFALVFGLVDLPFSFVADTLLLPITIPEQTALNRRSSHPTDPTADRGDDVSR